MTERGGPQFIPRPDQWREGRPAPWFRNEDDPIRDPPASATSDTVTSDTVTPDVGAPADLTLPSDVVAPAALGVDRVRETFPSTRRGRPSPVETSGAAPSAVLIPFFEDAAAAPGAGLHVLLTRRSWGLRTHSGEVSFPGGRCDLGESPAQAAVREAWEETALDPETVEVLGELDHLTTVTRRAYIVPVVGVLPGRPELVANPGEVDEVLFVPVVELMSPEVFREERWGSEELHRPVYFFELFGDTVWGATAAMLRQALALLVGADAGSLTDLDPARGVSTGFRLTEEQERGVV